MAMGVRDYSRRLLVCTALAWSIFLATPQPAPAQDIDKIDECVKKGVAYLKSAAWHYQDQPPNPGDEVARQRDVGVAALVGMALLESDVPKNDDAVNKAIGIVREAACVLR
jgi:hypothetical protein